jgi:hypothetical protein
MYTNIPQNDLIQITTNSLQHNNTPENQKELIILVKTILNQNYLQYMDHQYKQNEGLALGPHILNISRNIRATSRTQLYH